MDAVIHLDIGHDVMQEERLRALVVQLDQGEDKDLVEALLGHGVAVGVEARGLGVLRVNPHLLNLSGGQRLLLSGDHIHGEGHGDHHHRNHAGPHHVAGTLGKILAASGIVDCFCGVLLQQAHSDLSYLHERIADHVIRCRRPGGAQSFVPNAVTFRARGR